MSNENNQTGAMYEVVLNDEEQYSIWPADKALPLGWTKAGKQGSRESCLEYIKDVWLDMRPLSLKKQMASTSSGFDNPSALAVSEDGGLQTEAESDAPCEL